LRHRRRFDVLRAPGGSPSSRASKGPSGRSWSHWNSCRRRALAAAVLGGARARRCSLQTSELGSWAASTAREEQDEQRRRSGGARQRRARRSWRRRAHGHGRRLARGRERAIRKRREEEELTETPVEKTSRSGKLWTARIGRRRSSGQRTKMAMVRSSVAFSVRVRHIGDEAESDGDT